MRTWIMLIALAAALSFASTASAQSQRSTGRIILTSAERQQIRATPILARPYRFGHFYGNTVRRRHVRVTSTMARGR